MVKRAIREIFLRDKDRNKQVFLFLVRHRFVRLIAYWLYLNTDVIRPRTRETRPRRALILNAGKSGVTEDFLIAFDQDRGFELVCWPTFALRRIADAFLPASVTHDNYTSNDPAICALKTEYRNFLSRIWRKYNSIIPIDVVLSVNFGYYMQREFATALEAAGMPFIVLHKENLKSPGRVDFWHDVYKRGRGAFTGRKILVYNETERHLQVSSGVIDESRIAVTGMPRLDRIHKWRRNMAAQRNTAARPPQVLLFGWGLYDKISSVTHQGAAAARPRATGYGIANGAGEKPSWREIRKGTYDAVLQLARQRPDINVVVKGKPVKSLVAEDVELLRDKDGRPDNIRLIADVDAFEMIIESDVIVGFNTTALLEAIASGKPVIVPCFAEGASQSMKEWIIDLGDSVQYARSPEELVDRVIAQLNKLPDIPLELDRQATEALKYWVGNDDGNAGRRVLEAIRAELPGSS